MELILDQVSKEYLIGENVRRGIHNISMKVKEGQMVGICGESGSGKSTLFHLIAGILTPDSGRIIFDGNEIQKMKESSRSKYRNQEIGYIMQGYSLVNHLTVYENLSLPILFAKGSQKNLTERIAQVLKEVNLSGYENQHPGQLSGGEYNRIQIARALITRPKLILADEPTDGLDEKNAAHIVELLQQITSKGTAVMISTHQEQWVSNSNHIYRMA